MDIKDDFNIKEPLGPLKGFSEQKYDISRDEFNNVDIPAVIPDIITDIKREILDLKDFDLVDTTDIKKEKRINEQNQSQDSNEIGFKEADLIKCEEVNIKDEEVRFQDSLSNVEGSEDDFLSKFKEFIKVEIEGRTGKLRHVCNKCDYQTDRKQNFTNHLQRHLLSNKRVTIHKCSQCNYQTTFKSSLARHSVIHKSVSEIVMHKCNECSYSSKRACDLSRHIQRHAVARQLYQYNNIKFEAYKCNKCDYQTYTKTGLTKHKVTHKKDTYKCYMCNYQTTAKMNLRKHLIIHKSDFYKCNECGYQTAKINDFGKHSLIHKNNDEVDINTCNECNYRTKRMSDLNRHKQIHSANKFKCFNCGYETNVKNCLRQHMLNHKNRVSVIS